MLPVTKSLLPTVSRFFDDDWNNLFDWSNNMTRLDHSLPLVNVIETEDDFFVEMAAPGMRKEDFHVELNNNILTISREAKEDEKENGAIKYSRREFSYKSFTRSFNLNNQVLDNGKIDATYRDGILRIKLPKKEEAKTKPVRLIQIS